MSQMEWEKTWLPGGGAPGLPAQSKEGGPTFAAAFRNCCVQLDSARSHPEISPCDNPVPFSDVCDFRLHDSAPPVGSHWEQTTGPNDLSPALKRSELWAEHMP